MKRSTVKALTLAIIPFLLISAFIISFIWSGSHFYRYRLFKADLARSVAFAQQNNSLRAEYAGEVNRVHPDNAERIFDEITAGGFVAEEFEIPAEGGIRMDFGDGAYLKVWPAQSSGILISFLADDGQEYSLMTGELSRFNIIERLVQLAGLTRPNETWSP